MSAKSARASYDRGEAWERDIMAEPRPWSVYLQRTCPPGRLVRRGRYLSWVVTEKGVPDFHGAVDGRAFVFDAKATSDTRLPLACVDKDQAEHLGAANARGMLAFLFVRFDAAGRSFVLWWHDVGPLWWRWHRGETRRGEASLTVEDCAALGGEVEGGCWWWACGVGE